MEANNNKITCPKCNSQNVQSEGMIHLCMDCGYKWEDEVQTDLGEMIIYQSDEGVKLDVRLENKTVWLNIEQIAQLFNKVVLRLVSIFPIFSKKENWTKKWFVGNSDRPLNMVL